MSESEEPTEQGFQFFVPPEQEPGIYANTFAVWNTAYDFVIDFGLIQLAQPSDPEDPTSDPIVPARVVSRVILPRTLVFEFVKTLSASLDEHEKNWGPSVHPEWLLEPSSEENDDGVDTDII